MPQRQSDLVDVIIGYGMRDHRLIDAFRTVPRAEFVPPQLIDAAYEDRPLPIPHDQVTTQPSLSAQMIAALELTPTSKVLEVGTGYGFQTALLATLSESVVTIERWGDLAEQARSNLERQGISNVEVLVGDGSLGAPDRAPFDGILVSAAFPKVPAALDEQLAEGGRLVQPIGPGGSEVVSLFRKEEGRLRRGGDVVLARFVRLVGEQGFAEP